MIFQGSGPATGQLSAVAAAAQSAVATAATTAAPTGVYHYPGMHHNNNHVMSGEYHLPSHLTEISGTNVSAGQTALTTGQNGGNGHENGVDLLQKVVSLIFYKSSRFFVRVFRK